MIRIIEKMKYTDGYYAYGDNWAVNLDLFLDLKELINGRKLKFEEGFILDWDKDAKEEWEIITFEAGEKTYPTYWIHEMDGHKDKGFENGEFYDIEDLDFFESISKKKLKFTSVIDKFNFYCDYYGNFKAIKILKIWDGDDFLGILRPVIIEKRGCKINYDD